MSISLTEIGMQLTRYILPVIIIISVVRNSLNVLVLSRRPLYNHSCSRYFLSVGINNVFFYRLLINGYGINLSNYSLISCRLIGYINTLSSFITPYLIVFASTDRYCASSTNAQIRRFSTIRVTKWIICIIIGVFSLIFINLIVLYNLQPSKGYVCTLQTDTTYGQVYIITQVFLYAAIPPFLMMVFGLLTIRNIRGAGINPIVVSQCNRTEQQSTRMLYAQVSVLLTLPTCVIYLILALPNTISTTSAYSFAATICQLFFNSSSGSSFFLYILSGRIYKEELKRLVYNKFRIRFVNQIEPLVVNENINLSVVLPVDPRPTS